MVAPIIISNNSLNRIFWNISANVGPGQPNKADDVELVRLGYHSLARNPRAGNSPDETAAYSAVSNLGNFGPDLTAAIKIHQKVRGGTQDGIVSVIKASSGGYAFGAAAKSWIMVVLNNNIADVLADPWPLINLNSLAGPALSAKILECCTLKKA